MLVSPGRLREARPVNRVGNNLPTIKNENL